MRISSAQCVPFIIEAVQEDPAKSCSLTKELLPQLWNSLDGETDLEVLTHICEAMPGTIENGGRIFSNEELLEICQKCEEHLVKSEERRKAAEEERDDDDDEEKIVDIREAEKDDESELHCHIAEIFGKLFKTHKEATIDIAFQLDQYLITNSIDKNSHYRMNKVGLHLMCDIIEHLGEFPQIREQLFEVIFK